MIFGDLSTLLNLQKCSHFSLICLINGPTLAFLVIYDNKACISQKLMVHTRENVSLYHQDTCLLSLTAIFLSALYVNLSAWINLQSILKLTGKLKKKFLIIKRALEPINIYACLTPCCECACQFSKIEVSAHELFVSRYVRTALSHVPSSYRGR